ncbi:nuclease-related domain-containing protein [Sphingomonas glaciei]|uniref:NERD domain-containing protein n=1 Tax=Sphingomonas glaciei TaxID=2938948 RepID=A0ABY5MTT5_9SPHN|nr:nuclease-related domain-containing protein [Sphingomonas glaciei]UUR07918.1 NERD domain-containing protein [Sphingomonas glaciei]
MNLQVGVCATVILKEADDHSAEIAELERLKGLAPKAFKAIEREIRNIRSGASGEESAAHFINREFGRSERLAIIHDLRIGTEDDFAQIDHLLIHRLQATAWVLETKNYSGRLSCNEHGDWTVWYGGKPQPVPSPVAQAERQCRALECWLQQHGMGWISEVRPVVLVSPKSSVDRRISPKGASIVKSDHFATWLRDQWEGIGTGTALKMLSRHVMRGMSEANLRDLGDRLVGAHVPASRDWAAKFGISLDAQEGGCSKQRQVLQDLPAAQPEKSGDLLKVVETPHGCIKIARIPDGRFSIRNAPDEQLIELVRAACRGRAKWVPRYRNWLVTGDRLPEVLEVLSGCSTSEPLAAS